MTEINHSNDPAGANQSHALPAEVITVRGASQRNLQNLDLAIPLGKFTVVSGVSGSGKSALVFETLYGEGQARLWDSLLLGRHRPDRVPRPTVKEIAGLPPVIGVGQAAGTIQKAGSVASLAEIGDLIEGLFAATGVLSCPDCQVAVETQSRSAIVESVLALADRTKVMILAPQVRATRGGHAELFVKIARDGYVRARVDGTLIDVASPPVLTPTEPHTIEVVIDRLVVKEGLRPRLEESLETALELGRGTCLLCTETPSGWRDSVWSTQLACPQCQRSFPPIERRSFRPNSPVGGCPTCQGTGAVGSNLTTCPECHGQRLSEMGRAITIDAWSWPRFMRGMVDDALHVVQEWKAREQAAQTPFADPERRLIAGHVLPAIEQRLQSLKDIGLGYLQLDRQGNSLSLGEMQRTRLAAAIGGEVSSTLFLLDEPTTGLHHRDARTLVGMLRRLVDQGNTVVAVEHDLSVVAAADWVIDLGPGAGPHGGRLLAADTPQALSRHPASITGRALSEPVTKSNREWSPTEWLTFGPFRLHNIHDETLRLPLRALVGVSGVSGSGKSTLIRHGLVPAMKARLARESMTIPLEGGDELQAVKESSLRGSGQSPWAVTATLCGVWTEIRRLLARTKESRLRGFTAARFSWRHPEGQCRGCQGRGTVATTSVAVAGWTLPCPECRGRRLDRSTLQAKWQGHSAADLLEFSIDRAATVFAAIPRIGTVLQRLQTLGLEYLTLGQPAATLSGGERQRLRIGRDLAQQQAVPTLYVLDEPTAGLHATEIPRLVTALRALVEAGHTVVVIEHNLRLLHQCDWHIELGPGAGPAGGKITHTGRTLAE